MQTKLFFKSIFYLSLEKYLKNIYIKMFVCRGIPGIS